MQQNVELATPKQVATINGKAARLNIKLSVDPKTLTKEAASDVITEMYNKVDTLNNVSIPEENVDNRKINAIQLGLATKLVYQRWISIHKTPIVSPDVFRAEVTATYALMEQIGGDKNDL